MIVQCISRVSRLAFGILAVKYTRPNIKAYCNNSKTPQELIFINPNSEEHKQFKSRPKLTVSTLFLEIEQPTKSILMLKRSKKEDQSGLWGIPGGKNEKGETSTETLVREISEELKLSLKPSSIKFIGERWVSIPGWDYILNLYKHKTDRPFKISLSHEHTDYKWVPIALTKHMRLLKGQREAIDVAYPIVPQDKKTMEEIKKIIHSPNRARTVINLIGTSGSGKGTQGQILSKQLELPHISIGDYFRDELRTKTYLGELITTHDKRYPNIYTPDEICLGIILKRLSMPDCKKGFILDGFPRTSTQTTVLLNTILTDQDQHIPIYMDVPEEKIRARLKNRYICPCCGEQVREHQHKSPKLVCTKPSCDNATLEHRSEDIDQDKLNRRFNLFNKTINSMLNIIEKRDVCFYIKLNGNEPVEEVKSRIEEIVTDSVCLLPGISENNSNLTNLTLFSKESDADSCNLSKHN